MVSMGEWRLAVSEAAIRLGGRTEGVLWPKLEASVDGFEVAVWRTLGDAGYADRTEFMVWLSGWPTTSGLDLRPTLRSILRWPIIRERYIWFDDPDWDGAFVVRARDAQMVRLHLDAQRRAAVKLWFERGLHGFGGPGKVEGGRVVAYQHEVIRDPEVIVRNVQELVKLAKLFTE